MDNTSDRFERHALSAARRAQHAQKFIDSQGKADIFDGFKIARDVCKDTPRW